MPAGAEGRLAVEGKMRTGGSASGIRGSGRRFGAGVLAAALVAAPGGAARAEDPAGFEPGVSVASAGFGDEGGVRGLVLDGLPGQMPESLSRSGEVRKHRITGGVLMGVGGGFMAIGGVFMAYGGVLRRLDEQSGGTSVLNGTGMLVTGGIFLGTGFGLLIGGIANMARADALASVDTRPGSRYARSRAARARWAFEPAPM